MIKLSGAPDIINLWLSKFKTTKKKIERKNHSVTPLHTNKVEPTLIHITSVSHTHTLWNANITIYLHSPLIFSTTYCSSSFSLPRSSFPHKKTVNTTFFIQTPHLHHPHHLLLHSSHKLHQPTTSIPVNNKSIPHQHQLPPYLTATPSTSPPRNNLHCGFDYHQLRASSQPPWTTQRNHFIAFAFSSVGPTYNLQRSTSPCGAQQTLPPLHMFPIYHCSPHEAHKPSPSKHSHHVEPSESLTFSFETHYNTRVMTVVRSQWSAKSLHLTNSVTFVVASTPSISVR